MHALTGTWTANLAKSHRHVNHQFHRATMHVDVSGLAVSLRFEGVNAAGQREEGVRQFEADGVARPDAAAPGVLSTTTLDDRRLEGSRPRTTPCSGAPRTSYQKMGRR